MPDENGKCKCARCGKIFKDINFYQFKDGSKSNLCKPCLTAHIDNFDPSTFTWVLKEMDVPYIPVEWNVIRDRAFAADPYKMNGTTVMGKYLAKMRLQQWKEYTYADTEKLQEREQKKTEYEKKEREKYQQGLKEQLAAGNITEAEYKTLVSTETQNKQLSPLSEGDIITGIIPANKSVDAKNKKRKTDKEVATVNASSYQQALAATQNPFQEKNFLSEEQLQDDSIQKLTHEDKIYLAMKWGRLYTPNQWVSLERMYTDFMNSFDIQGAARKDTLKKICKTSLKMDECIDAGDIDGYQRLSRVYDSLMKSAKFTEAQNKDADGASFDSVSAVVDYVEAHSGQIPRYRCKEPRDVIDKILKDLKQYNKTLIYEDKSLAQEIEKYLKEKKIREEMKRDKEEAEKKGKRIELKDKDYIEFKNNEQKMKDADAALTDESIQKDYLARRVNYEK